MRNKVFLFVVAVFTWSVSALAQPNLLWSRTYGGEQSEKCFSVLQTIDGGYAFAGWSSSFVDGGTDLNPQTSQPEKTQLSGGVNQIDLATYEGANTTARAIEHVRATRPDVATMTYEQICKAAFALKKQPNVIDSSGN